MIWHRPKISSLHSRLVASGSALWWISVASPAASCTLVDPEASTLASIALSNSYWIGAALLVVAMLLLDALEPKWSLTSIIGLVVVVFHPAWTIPPLYDPGCVFQNVELSQVASVFLTYLLVLRTFRSLSVRGRKLS
jgi:hypothetical protein